MNNKKRLINVSYFKFIKLNYLQLKFYYLLLIFSFFNNLRYRNYVLISKPLSLLPKIKLKYTFN